MRRMSLFIATATFSMSGVAQARPNLTSVTPAANATVAKPSYFDLHFSEKLMSAFSKADLKMTAMPGMAAMKMARTAVLAADILGLVVTPKASLA